MSWFCYCGCMYQFFRNFIGEDLVLFMQLWCRCILVKLIVLLFVVQVMNIVFLVFVSDCVSFFSGLLVLGYRLRCNCVYVVVLVGVVWWIVGVLLIMDIVGVCFSVFQYWFYSISVCVGGIVCCIRI